MEIYSIILIVLGIILFVYSNMLTSNDELTYKLLELKNTLTVTEINKTEDTIFLKKAIPLKQQKTITDEKISNTYNNPTEGITKKSNWKKNVATILSFMIIIIGTIGLGILFYNETTKKEEEKVVESLTQIAVSLNTITNTLKPQLKDNNEDSLQITLQELNDILTECKKEMYILNESKGNKANNQ